MTDPKPVVLMRLAYEGTDDTVRTFAAHTRDQAINDARAWALLRKPQGTGVPDVHFRYVLEERVNQEWRRVDGVPPLEGNGGAEGFGDEFF